MPIYQFEGPDGRVHEIEGPEGSTPEQAFSQLQQAMSPQEGPATNVPSWVGEYASDFNKPETMQDKRDYVTGQIKEKTGVPVPQWLHEGMAGMGRRVAQIGSLGMHEGNPDTNELLDASTAATIGSVGGDIAAGGLLAAAAPVAGPAAALINSITKPKALLSAMGGGAAYGAATSPDRMEGAIAGGLGSAVGQQVPKLLAKAVKPQIDDAARALIDEGIDLTPGEMLGGGLKAFEDKASSIPIAGDFISAAKKRSLVAFNRSIVDDAMKSIGTRLKTKNAGPEMFREADAAIGQYYDDVLQDMPIKLSDDLMDSIINPKAPKRAPKKAKNIYKNVVDGVAEMVEGDNLTGDAFKRADSYLRNQYQRLLRNTDPTIADVGEKLKSLHGRLISQARSQHPGRAPMLDAADMAYAKYMTAVDAAAKSAANDLFTPNQLVRSMGSKMTKKQRAKSTPWLDYAKSAQEVLPSTIPDSGTAGRGMMGLLVGGAIDPTLGGAGVAGAGLYSKTGQDLIRKALLNRPEYAGYARGLLEQAAPLGAAIGRGGFLAND